MARVTGNVSGGATIVGSHSAIGSCGKKNRDHIFGSILGSAMQSGESAGLGGVYISASAKETFDVSRPTPKHSGMQRGDLESRVARAELNIGALIHEQVEGCDASERGSQSKRSEPVDAESVDDFGGFGESVGDFVVKPDSASVVERWLDSL
jgi:hypothetical protein